jgi:hypothetical protein
MKKNILPGAKNSTHYTKISQTKKPIPGTKPKQGQHKPHAKPSNQHQGENSQPINASNNLLDSIATHKISTEKSLV